MMIANELVNPEELSGLLSQAWWKVVACVE
jgi:hypothetical protein